MGSRSTQNFGAFRPKSTMQPPSMSAYPRVGRDGSRTSTTQSPPPHPNATPQSAISIGDSSPTESQSIIVGNTHNVQKAGSGVEEFRKVEISTRRGDGKRSRRHPRGPESLDDGTSKAHKPKPQLFSRSTKPHNDPISDDDDQDELALSGPPSPRHKTPKRPQLKDGLLPSQKPIVRPVETITINIPLSKRTRERDEVDELNDKDNSLHTVKKPRLLNEAAKRNTLSGISTRGDIIPTKFYQEKPAANPESCSFTVVRACCEPTHLVDTQQALEVTREGDGLVLASPGAKRYDWLQISFEKLIKVTWCSDSTVVQIDRMSSTTNSGTNIGGKLWLQLDDPPRFLEWVKKSAVSVTTAEKGRMNRRFNNAWISIEKAQGQAKAREMSGSKPDDLRLMERNQLRRQLSPTPVEEKRPSFLPRKRLKDSMQTNSEPFVIDHEDEYKRKRPDFDVQLDHESRAASSAKSRISPQEGLSDRDRRTNSRFFVPSRSSSPAPAPAPKWRWTQEISDWDKDWRVSLSYARTTIHKEDIGRLDEGEFLNDSIISFYLQYLHKRVDENDKAKAARFYFHSSFFWDALKPTSGKVINYDKVKSWTSRVDLFSYDYIIVPVNENSHWYVAVICNPGKLLQTQASVGNRADPSNGDTEKPSREASVVASVSVDLKSAPPSSHASPRTAISVGIGRMGLEGSVEIETNNGPIVIEDEVPVDAAFSNTIQDDDAEEIVLVCSDFGPPAKRKKGKANLASKRDSTKIKDSTKARASTIAPEKELKIITFDSLGSPHSPVATALKNYLICEARNRKGIEIDDPGALGHSAKKIPLQDNYWDCGVYLLAYMDALLKDPDGFMRKVLQKKTLGTDEDFVCSVDAAKLRGSIRTTILEEQRRYQSTVEADAQVRKEQRKLNKQGFNGSLTASPLRAEAMHASPAPALSPAKAASASPLKNAFASRPASPIEATSSAKPEVSESIEGHSLAQEVYVVEDNSAPQ